MVRTVMTLILTATATLWITKVSANNSVERESERIERKGERISRDAKHLDNTVAEGVEDTYETTQEKVKSDSYEVEESGENAKDNLEPEEY